MAIKIKVMSDDDEEFYSAWVECVPRVGEYLWARPNEPLIVKEVAHWLLADASLSGRGNAIHSVAIYAEPINKEGDCDDS